MNSYQAVQSPVYIVKGQGLVVTRAPKLKNLPGDELIRLDLLWFFWTSDQTCDRRKQSDKTIRGLIGVGIPIFRPSLEDLHVIVISDTLKG